MNVNKFNGTLEFDDDIDFDGLDEEFQEDSFSDEENSDFAEDKETEESTFTVELHPEQADDSNELEEQEKNPETPCESVKEEEPVAIYTDITEPELTHESVYISAPKHEKSIKVFCVVNAVISLVTLCALVFGICCGSNYINEIRTDLNEKNNEVAELIDKNNSLEADYLEAISIIEEGNKDNSEIIPSGIEQGKIIHYDSYVGYSWMPVISGIKQNTYKKENFTVDDRYRMHYTENGEESSYFGIDVSSYQGEIDWQLVKEDGVEFAFLRIGYRGYGEEGKLCADEFFARNYEAARDAGIDLGIYFFSQATSVEEAVEEAEFVLSLLEERKLEYPIVFDWETIFTGDPEDIPRTDDVMPQTLTLSAIAFCETVKDAGYDAMIYTNKKQATIKYDLRQLSDYPVWLAYYDTELNYCYDFDVWQYGTGQVDGIEGEVDVNIALIK